MVNTEHDVDTGDKKPDETIEVEIDGLLTPVSKHLWEEAPELVVRTVLKNRKRHADFLEGVEPAKDYEAFVKEFGEEV